MADARQLMRSRAHSPLIPVALGLVVFGLANFAFLAFAARDLGPAASAPVSVMWTVVNAFGIGLFMPLEQDLARRLSATRALGGRGVVGWRPARYAVGAFLGIVVVLAVVGGVIGRTFFAGAPGMVWVLGAGLAAQAVAYATRGLLAGYGAFGRYGAQLALDGVFRTVGSVALAAGGATATGYGWVLVAAPVLASAVALIGWSGRRHRSGTEAEASPSSAPFAALVAVSVLSQVLANAGPMLIAALAAPSEQAVSGKFVLAVTVARIPLFAFAAVQAVFLPLLAARVATDDVVGFGRTTRTALGATALLGTVGALVILAVGPFLQSVLYGPEFAISRWIVFLVAVSGALFMLAQVFSIALLAHGDDWAAAWGWALGVVGIGLGLLIDRPLAEQVAWALCTGAFVATVAHAFRVRAVLARWKVPS
ncbi:lipopolysaccharide biosynthesis protein [Cellulomonas sp.]|uniref:lipopolysaccharide biosynthesis protein n=1 Tax=Cellulomonas sp. TaxID=40001 RepID=UPI003BAC65E6